MRLRVYLISSIACAFFGCVTQPELPVGEPVAQQYINRGRSLVQGLAACGFCHSEDASPASALSGGRKFYDRYGTVVGPNLTPTQAALATWSTAEIMRALRSSIGKDETKLSRDAHKGFEWLSDADALSIVGFLRRLPPVEHSVERRTLSFIERNTTGLLDTHPEMLGYVPEINSRESLEYGKYLVDNVARCGSCHNSEDSLITDSEYLAGGLLIRTETGEKYAPGIRGGDIDGLQSWTAIDIVTFLKTGVTPDNEHIDPNFCPIAFYAQADPSDLDFIAQYLKSLD